MEKHDDSRQKTRADSSRGHGKGHARGRGRGRSSGFRANNAQVEVESETSIPPGVSKETWSAIVNLLQSTTASCDKISGKTKCVDFLLDYGVSHHMMGDVDLVNDTIDIPQSIIVLPNGKHTFVTKE